jgi:hypothetical protein
VAGYAEVSAATRHEVEDAVKVGAEVRIYSTEGMVRIWVSYLVGGFGLREWIVKVLLMTVLRAWKRFLILVAPS